MIRKGLKAEDFNDDVLGRALDKLYRASTEGIFMQIAANAYGEYSGRFLHNDTTSMSLQGEYEHEEGVKQRWVVVFSEKAFARETKTLEKKIKKEKEQVEREVWHLSNQEFYNEEDALKAAREREKQWKYHKISATAMETKRKRENGGRGRPRKDEPTQTVYRVKAEFAEDKSVIEKEMLKKGKFIVATNELDSEKLSDEEVLKAYKGQQHAAFPSLHLFQDV